MERHSAVKVSSFLVASGHADSCNSLRARLRDELLRPLAALLGLALAGCASAAEVSPSPGVSSAPPGVASTPAPVSLPASPPPSSELLASLPPGQMTPYAEELLDRVIELDGRPGVRIVEWRPLPGREATTGPTPEAVAVLASTCRAALEAFDAFVASEVPFPIPFLPDWQIDVSLLPTGKEGPVARTFADHDGRFAKRERTYAWDGALQSIVGYADHASRFIFVRHDVLLADGRPNERTMAIFAHELFHAMSWQSGLFAMHPLPRGTADGALARRFTTELGLGE